MSNLEEHEAEQAEITALCEAGECDHDECHADRVDARVAELAAELDDGANMTNAHRGARILRLLTDFYGDRVDTAITDTLCDLRHACDLAGLQYRDQDRKAQAGYEYELFEERPAKGGAA